MVRYANHAYIIYIYTYTYIYIFFFSHAHIFTYISYHLQENRRWFRTPRTMNSTQNHFTNSSDFLQVHLCGSQYGWSFGCHQRFGFSDSYQAVAREGPTGGPDPSSVCRGRCVSDSRWTGWLLMLLGVLPGVESSESAGCCVRSLTGGFRRWIRRRFWKQFGIPCGRMTQKYQRSGCTDGCHGMSWHINSNEGCCKCSPKIWPWSHEVAKNTGVAVDFYSNASQCLVWDLVDTWFPFSAETLLKIPWLKHPSSNQLMIDGDLIYSRTRQGSWINISLWCPKIYRRFFTTDPTTTTDYTGKKTREILVGSGGLPGIKGLQVAPRGLLLSWFFPSNEKWFTILNGKYVPIWLTPWILSRSSWKSPDIPGHKLLIITLLLASMLIFHFTDSRFSPSPVSRRRYFQKSMQVLRVSPKAWIDMWNLTVVYALPTMETSWPSLVMARSGVAGMETLRLVVQNFCKRSGTKQNIICKYVAGLNGHK